jgi:molybdenum cofactor synthesis domain-containing protein
MQARVFSINISEKKGKKSPVEKALFKEGWGIEKDYHAGTQRCVSLLEAERIKEYGLSPGSFGENITTEGLSLKDICVGENLFIEGGVILKVSQKGKECPAPCWIKRQVGECIMPEFGVFAEVARGGWVKEGASMSKEEILLVSILTISDSVYEGRREDKSKETIEKVLQEKGHYLLLEQRIINDDKERIKECLRELSRRCDLLLTCGGTGVGPRDVTPEATKEVLDKELPGFCECMRMHSYHITPHALLSRAVAGFLGGCLVVNLPGSPKGAAECLSFVERAIPHAIKVARGQITDCARGQNG